MSEPSKVTREGLLKFINALKEWEETEKGDWDWEPKSSRLFDALRRLIVEHGEWKRNYDDLRRSVGEWETKLAEIVLKMYSFNQVGGLEIRYRKEAVQERDDGLSQQLASETRDFNLDKEGEGGRR